MLGTDNPADMMTKYLDALKTLKFSEMLKLTFREGRSKEGLKVQKEGSTEGKGVIASIKR